MNAFNSPLEEAPIHELKADKSGECAVLKYPLVKWFDVKEQVTCVVCSTDDAWAVLRGGAREHVGGTVAYRCRW